MKHDSHLAIGFIRPSSSTGITQENIFTRFQFFIIIFFIILFSVTLSHPHHPLSLVDDAHAEGSKEVIAAANGQGRRYVLLSLGSVSYLLFRAYAKEGEFINIGNSAFRRSNDARIRYTSPDGTVVGQCPLVGPANRQGSEGVIFNFAEETAGPGTALGGYNPCVVQVPAGQGGVWEIEMSPPRADNANPSARCPTDLVTQDWPHPSGRAQANCTGIIAYDVTVSQGGSFAGNDASAYGTAVPGRVYVNQFRAYDYSRTNPRFWTTMPYVLTNDGFQYEVRMNNFIGEAWVLFANNKGYRNIDGTPAYVSNIDGTLGNNFSVHNALLPDTSYPDDPAPPEFPDYTHKIFFNPPDVTMPASAPAFYHDRANLSLRDLIDAAGNVIPSITGNPATDLGASHPTFLYQNPPAVGGIENVEAFHTCAAGVSINFDLLTDPDQINNTVEIQVDANRNGNFGDPEDVTIIKTPVTLGANTAFWDGIDGLGNETLIGTTEPKLTVAFTPATGEVHFPAIDVEGNFGGVRIKALNGPNQGEDTFFWNDTITPAASNPEFGKASGTSHTFLGDNDTLDSWIFKTDVDTLRGIVQASDMGDGPDSYGTDCTDSGEGIGPEHAVPQVYVEATDSYIYTPQVFMGALVDDDFNGLASGAANNDDTLNLTDEDGLLPLGEYEPLGELTCTGANGTYTTQANEYCAVVNVTNNGTIPAQLVGWLDFTVDGTFTDNIDERSLPDLGGNGTGVLVADSSGAAADNTFISGNILPGFNGNVVLVWRGLGDVDEQQPDTTYLRIRLTTEDGTTPGASDFFSDASPSPNGPARDGEVEDHLVTLDTLPVTLSYFDSTRSGSRVNIDWGTSSELFNVGFQLWGLDGADGQWEKLHNWLVKSGSGNAVEPQSYTKRVRIPTSIDQLVSVGISSVDSDGSEHYYGPFELGVSYGELGDLAPIAWDQVRAELDTRMAAQGYTKSGVNGYRKASSTSTLALSNTDNESVIEFRVSTPGVYRITGSELPQEWHSAPKGELAVLDYQGNGVVRHVQAKGQGSGSTRALGAAGSIYFYSEGVNETQRLYSEAKVYRLVLDSARALNAPIQSKQGVTSGFSDSYREVSVVEEDQYYIFHSAVDDPWLDEVVIGFSDKLRVRRQPVPVEADLLIDDSATLLLGLGRSSALGAIDNDGDGVQDAEHIVTGTVTDADGVKVKLDPVSAVGSGRWDLALPIPAGTLLGDANGIVNSGAFFNAGEGYAFSEVHIDSIGLEYSRPYVSKAGEDHLLFRGPDTGELGYSVTVPDTGWPWVFASDGSNLVRIGLESQRRVTDSAGVKWREVTFSKLLGSELSPLSIHYWVSGRNGFYGVEGLVDKVVPSQASILAQAQGSDYVMVSHPMFMGPDQAGVDPLSTYADFKQSQGYTVSIVNYLDIVESFGGGQAGPWGLTHYLSELKLQSPLLRYVLLVGSSVYDHSDKLGTGALTFIPGHYVPGSHSDYTVSDVPYISNGDGGLFAYIGRWPVRELSELQVIVDKSMQWGSAAHHQGEALLIAEHTVVGEEINFAQALDGVADVLPDTYSHHKVYVDALLAADPDLSLTQALALAKGQIIDALNNGPEVVVYNGHASTGQLSNQNLFKHSDVDEVTTPGAEIWVPLSCYVTYYESTTVNTLAHQLLFTGNAVAITGAMLLSNQAENIQMGQSILDSTFNQGQSIGEAVNQAKAIQNNPSLTHNWATLGDPSSVLMTQ